MFVDPGRTATAGASFGVGAGIEGRFGQQPPNTPSVDGLALVRAGWLPGPEVSR